MCVSSSDDETDSVHQCALYILKILFSSDKFRTAIINHKNKCLPLGTKLSLTKNPCTNALKNFLTKHKASTISTLGSGWSWNTCAIDGDKVIKLAGRAFTAIYASGAADEIVVGGGALLCDIAVYNEAKNRTLCSMGLCISFNRHRQQVGQRPQTSTTQEWWTSDNRSISWK